MSFGLACLWLARSLGSRTVGRILVRLDGEVALLRWPASPTDQCSSNRVGVPFHAACPSRRRRKGPARAARLASTPTLHLRSAWGSGLEGWGFAREAPQRCATGRNLRQMTKHSPDRVEVLLRLPARLFPRMPTESSMPQPLVASYRESPYRIRGSPAPTAPRRRSRSRIECRSPLRGCAEIT